MAAAAATMQMPGRARALFVAAIHQGGEGGSERDKPVIASVAEPVSMDEHSGLAQTRPAADIA